MNTFIVKLIVIENSNFNRFIQTLHSKCESMPFIRGHGDVSDT